MALPTLPADIAADIRATPYEHIVECWNDWRQVYGGGRYADELLARADRYYLLAVLLHRPDVMHPWLYARCREVEANPDGYLDLWAREHYKSTIITFAGAIHEIVKDPEVTIGIFSHTNPVATKFLDQIKLELENNELLKTTFPDIFWRHPRAESTRWSKETGIVVKRLSNSKEATVEAHGLVDGQPTGAHFSLRIYDDVVTIESVSTPEQVAKTTAAHALSSNLGAKQEDGTMRAWHVGTRYSFADTYHDILERKSLVPRIHPATEDGTADGKPVFMTPAGWKQKKLEQPMAILAAQMLVNPAAGNQAMFAGLTPRFIDIRPATLNVYILCDPASSRKKGSDRTAIAVMGIAQGGTKWLLDGYHHRMKLAERWACVKLLRRHWMHQPGVQMVKVGYERYGSTADLEYFEEQMERDRDAWEIEELAWPRDGPGAKLDRIQRLEPDFRNGKIWLAYDAIDPDGNPYMTKNQARVTAQGQGFRVFKPTKRRDEDGNIYSLNKTLLSEYALYPFSPHDDLLDAVSRIYDIDPTEPIIIDDSMLEPQVG